MGLSRNNKSFNEKYYPVFNAISAWSPNAVLDGEICVLNDKGVSHFGSLQNWRSEADGDLVYYAFDLLWLNGRSLLDEPLEERLKKVKKRKHYSGQRRSIERMTRNRKGKIYVDYLQNRPKAILAAPYSLRPKPGATVSMPLYWEEVKTGLQLKNFTIKCNSQN